MKSWMIYSILCLIVIIGFAWAAQSEFKSASITVALPSGDGRVLTLNGVAVQNIYLGVSFYPDSYKDPYKEGVHSIIELRAGSFTQEIVIPPKMGRGTWEAALWSTKITADKCTIKDCFFCKKNGYHLDGQLAYVCGLVGFTSPEGGSK